MGVRDGSGSGDEYAEEKEHKKEQCSVFLCVSCIVRASALTFACFYQQSRQ